jgi:diaminopimelate decarboxylase
MHFIDGVLHLGDIPATDLIAKYGSPLYVYEQEVLERQLEKVRQAFASIPFRAAYAIKANFNLSLLRLIGERGFAFDAVSPGEVFLARRAGFSGDQIWFTCSNISLDDLRLIDDSAVVINLNGMSELDAVIEVGLKNPLALRVNPDVGAGHHRDVVTGGFGVKFGFDLAELPAAIDLIDSEGLQLVGLHAHIGSGIDDVAPLLESARTLLRLAENCPQLRWINFGGGIAVPYAPGDKEFPIDEYGAGLAAIAGPMLRERGLTAMIEPGRYLVAECGTLLATATAKRISHGVEWLGCDTGFNHLARPSKYGSYHHILNASRGRDEELRWNQRPDAGPAETVVAGNICESGDVFTRGIEGVEPRRLPSTDVGDILAICDAGAYGFSMGSHYNARLLPAEVLVSGGRSRLIRRRQTFEELLQGHELQVS